LCSRLAQGLREQKIGPGDRVAVLSRNSHAFAALRFALARIGAVLVPINFMLNAEEIAFILRSAGAIALAVGPEFVDVGSAAAAGDTKVAEIYWLPGETAAPAPGAMVSFDDLCRGQPLAVPIVTASNRHLVRRAAGGASQEVGQAVLVEPWHERLF
jgi:fatty-acyl-CoA synthase